MENPFYMRVTLGCIALGYVVFGAIMFVASDRYDAATNTFRYDASAFGPALFVMFGVALIAHLAVAILSRSWLYSALAAVSALLLSVLFVWVLHKVTGDSL